MTPTNGDPPGIPEQALEEIQARLMELEIRSEERRAEVARMDEFVTAFDGRIRALEKEVQALRALLDNPPDQSPAAGDEKPPHY